MAELFDRREVPLHEQIACAEAHLQRREDYLTSLVARGIIRQGHADIELAPLRAIVTTLREVAEIGHTAAANTHGG